MAVKNASGDYNIDRPKAPVVDRVLTGKKLFTGRRHPGADGAAVEDSAVRDSAIDTPAVVVVDGLIDWVGPFLELPAKYAELPVEAHPGATLMPGMVETHAHLGGFAYNAEPDVPDPEVHDSAWHALSAVKTARQLASMGVTTVQSLGARNFTDVAAREAIATGLAEGPRIVASGPQLTTTGGHSWPAGGEVDSITQIKHKVREHHKAGVDVIKVMATGGFGTSGSAPWNAQFTTEELTAIVEEAHRLGKHTAAHAHGTQGIRRAVEAGFDYIAHVSFVGEDGITAFDEDLADQTARQGTYVDLSSPPSYPAVEGETATPHAKALYDHGVKFVVGHDIGAVVPPSAYVDGLAQMVASGLPVEEVLIAATSRGAAAVGLAGVTGVIEPGYAADILVVNGDPTERIEDLASLEEVIIGGRTFHPDWMPQFDRASFGSGESGYPAARPGELDARTDWIENQRRAAAHPAD